MPQKEYSKEEPLNREPKVVDLVKEYVVNRVKGLSQHELWLISYQFHHEGRSV